MPVLANPRHELFAQEIAKGKKQIEAYALAGYQPVDANASRLISDDKVAARIAEIQAAAAQLTICTVHDIARQLDDDRQFAREMEAPAAAVSATMGKAKVLGLMVEKVEHTGVDGKDLIPARSDTELARLIAFQLTKASKESPASGV